MILPLFPCSLNLVVGVVWREGGEGEGTSHHAPLDRNWDLQPPHKTDYWHLFRAGISWYA